MAEQGSKRLSFRTQRAGAAEGIPSNVSVVKSSSLQFPELEGLRVIFSFWVVLLHSSSLLVFSSREDSFAPLSTQDHFLLRTAPWQGSVRGFGAQVDVFFMMSGFLLSYPLLLQMRRRHERIQKQLQNQQKKQKLQEDQQQQLQTPTQPSVSKKLLLFQWYHSVGKKCVRLWPGAIASALLMFASKDLNTHRLGPLLWSTISFKVNEAITSSSLLVSWSNRVEVVATALLTAIILVFDMHHKSRAALLSPIRGKAIALVLILLSLLPVTFLFLTSNVPLYANALMRGQLQRPPLFLVSKERIQWMNDHYNLQLPSYHFTVQQENDLFISYARNMYLNTAARITPHFVGFFLALCLVAAPAPPPPNEGSVARTRATNQERKQSSSSWLWWWLFNSSALSTFFACISWLLIAFPFVIGVVNSRVARAKGPYHQDNFLALASKNIYDTLSTLSSSSSSDSPPTSHTASTPPTDPITFFDYYFVVLSRPVTSAAYAYLIYRLIGSNCQPQKQDSSLTGGSSGGMDMGGSVGGSGGGGMFDFFCKSIGRFLSHPLFQFAAHYSYLIYILHYRILFEIIFRFLKPNELDSLLVKSLSYLSPTNTTIITNTNTNTNINVNTNTNTHVRGLAHVFIYAMLTYTITLLLAMLVSHFFESKVHKRFRNLLEQLLRLGLCNEGVGVGRKSPP